MDDKGLSSVKTHKRKSKNLVDPGDLVSEKSLQKSYKILGQVIYNGLHSTVGCYNTYLAIREKELSGC